MIITIMVLCHRKPISHQSSYYRNRPALFDESVVSNARDIICWLSQKIRLEHNIVVPIQSTNLLDSVLFCHLLFFFCCCSIWIDKIRRINTTWRSSRHGIIFCSPPSYRVVWSGPSNHGVSWNRSDNSYGTRPVPLCANSCNRMILMPNRSSRHGSWKVPVRKLMSNKIVSSVRILVRLPVPASKFIIAFEKRKRKRNTDKQSLGIYV